MAVLSGHTPCQFTDTVFPIPLSTALAEIFIYGIVGRHIGGTHIAQHILIPCIHPCQPTFDGHLIQDTLIHRLIRLHPGVVGTVLAIAHHRIITEHVA